jgi:hypothetical protein
MITVIGVCREMGVEPYPEMTWSVGAAVRDEYVRRFGRLPDKRLGRKTYEDKGSHCFAVYPEDMKDFIKEEIGRHTIELARQERFNF